MKHLTYFLITLFLLVGCSGSDSPEEMEEIVLNPPSLSTSSVTEITETSVTVGGNITNDGGAAITERGVVWGLNANPTTADNKQSVGTGTGSFTTSIGGLESNTSYFVRAYAINSEGTAYGSQQQFTTLEPEPVQKVFEGDLEFKNQREVDDFGAMNYNEITGTLTIKSESFRPIKNFNSLRALTTVGGDLRIVDNQFIDLKNLSGLNSISTIGGYLIISGNYWLENIEGLKNLNEVKGLEITNNGNLFFIDGLENISRLENLDIRGNGQLRNLEGLSQLNLVEDKVTIESNQAIENLDGLRNLTELKSLYIGFNERLTDLKGLEKIQTLEILEIDYNITLSNVDGLSQLTSVEDRLWITLNRLLDDFCGLNSLFENNGVPENFRLENNLHNPTIEDIASGNCAQ